MPLIRKVVQIGNSRAIFLPKTWLEYHESKIGQEIRLIAMEVDKKLWIEPYIPQKPLRPLKERKVNAIACKACFEGENHE